jgi:putative photosynthetic complex assembly protein
MSQTMTHHEPGSRSVLNRGALLIVGLFLVSAVALIAYARFTGVGVLRMPISNIVEYRDLTFFERADGGFEVRHAGDGKILESLELAKGGGFIQVIISGMMWDRTPKGIARDAPYRLARHSDGNLILHDPSTGRAQTVNSFGSVNREVFAKLLSRGE